MRAEGEAIHPAVRFADLPGLGLNRHPCVDPHSLTDAAPCIASLSLAMTAEGLHPIPLAKSRLGVDGPRPRDLWD